MKKKRLFKSICSMMPVILLALGLSVSSCSTSPNSYPAPDDDPNPVTAAATRSITPPEPINRAEEGIHIGIIKFAEKSEDITNGFPVLLDRNGRTSLTSSIDLKISPTRNPGTSLFHAVHLAMANMKKNESCLPENLDAVYIITFTDGLDNQSAGLSKLSTNKIEGKTFDDTMGDRDNYTTGYADYIREELQNRRIAGLPIYAHSVGIRGDDVPNNESFNRHLESIASPGNSKILDNFNDLQASFSNIADSLNLNFTQTNLVLTTPLLVNTRVRITFDGNTRNPADVWASKKYVEGTITSPSEGKYNLINIACSDAISCYGQDHIAGIVDDVNVHFSINGVCGYDPTTDKANTRLWRMSEGSWQPDSEYSSEGSILTTNERHSAVIYLVLDCSSSLSPRQNEDIKRAVTDFVNNLYNRYYGL